MRYIIMADGEGSRWNNFNDIPKHLVNINGETLLQRTVRLIKEVDNESEVIITSRDKRYDVKGALRYEPKSNVLEIDRFTYELIEDNVCFLYGDTLYNKENIEIIANTNSEEIIFFGDERSIIAVKVMDASLFKKHIDIVKDKFLKKEIDKCIGWQVYQSFAGLTFGTKQIVEKKFLLVSQVNNINAPEDLERLMGDLESRS